MLKTYLVILHVITYEMFHFFHSLSKPISVYLVYKQTKSKESQLQCDTHYLEQANTNS